MKPPQLLEDTAATSLYPAGEPAEPFGETPYLERIEFYAGQALERKRAGAAFLAIRNMPGLHEARAAVLGCRAAELSAYVTLRAVTDGREAEPSELLAALICLQSLGADAFGLDFDRADDGLAAAYRTMAPYAQIPLLARPRGSVGGEDYAALPANGVDTLCWETPEQGALAAVAMAAAPSAERRPRPEDAPLLLCDGSGVYYLEEDFTLSEEIDCCPDMAEIILEQEELAYDALCFHVKNIDDAINLGLNAHMMRCAACIRAEGPEALEMALALYCGRALVDARSDVDAPVMEELANAYGAIIR